MKKKIKALTDEELDKLCSTYVLPCPSICQFKLNDEDIVKGCKLSNPKYKNELVEVEE